MESAIIIQKHWEIKRELNRRPSGLGALAQQSKTFTI